MKLGPRGRRLKAEARRRCSQRRDRVLAAFKALTPREQQEVRQFFRRRRYGRRRARALALFREFVLGLVRVLESDFAS